MYGLNKTESFPPQQLPYRKKTKEWRKKCVDWADSKNFFNSDLVRNSVMHKKINYDLLNGKLYMDDLALIVNPDDIQASYIPDNIQHYPIINSKLEVLIGEESKRIFDFKVIVTNPNAISEIEINKKNAILQELQQLIQSQVQSEEEFQEEVQKLQRKFNYEWQDLKEIQGNELLNHYSKEYNMPLLFNTGFMDALAVGEEIYQCDIVGGEPIIERLDPLKVRIFRSGRSNKIEDADMIVIEDYWSPGRIIDTFYDVLTAKDIKYIEESASTTRRVDEMDNVDPRYGIVDSIMIDDVLSSSDLFTNTNNANNLPYDIAGNIKVLRVYWKSRRKIKKVKSYDPQTAEEVYHFYNEDYKIDESMGEEEQIFYVNEAWEGTKIGEDIYVNMRPRIVQYNRLDNPSRCHFGIVGSIYNLNNDKPYSLVDRMKQYNYLYDVIHDRLNKMIARNWGKIIQLDFAKVPKGWDIEKWMYYAKINGIAVVDSFKEGNIGASTGKLAGALNNASSGVIDAEFGNSIQMLINLLEFIKSEMSEVAGISKQREGQISNRETVGGVERATLQSAHITEKYFIMHDDVKKRALECFLETAKIALKGRNKKFQYILSDNSQRIIDIDGDVFAEADYGLLVDSSNKIQELNSKLDMLAQAGLQNQTLSFSTIMKIYTSISTAEKIRLVEQDEQAIQERNAQAQQQQLQVQQEQIQAQMQQKQAELEQKESQNIRDNETKILIATMQAQNNEINDGIEEPDNDLKREELKEKIRQFDESLKWEKEKHAKDIEVKKQQIRNKPKTTK